MLFFISNLKFDILVLIFGGYTLIFHDVYSFSRQWNAYILLIIIYLNPEIDDLFWLITSRKYRFLVSKRL